jgi:hypothetical protein
MDDRLRRLLRERHEEGKRFEALVRDAHTEPEWEAARTSLARLHELDGEIAEARGASLTGEATPRP